VVNGRPEALEMTRLGCGSRSSFYSEPFRASSSPTIHIMRQVMRCFLRSIHSSQRSKNTFRNNIHPAFLSSRKLLPLTLCYSTGRVSAALDWYVRELPDHREGLIVSLAEWCVARPVDDNSVDASRRRSHGF